MWISRVSWDTLNAELAASRIEVRSLKWALDESQTRCKLAEERYEAAETRYHDLTKTVLTPVPATITPQEPDFEQRARKANERPPISDQTINELALHLQKINGLEPTVAKAEAQRLFDADLNIADEGGLMAFIHDAGDISPDPE